MSETVQPGGDVALSAAYLPGVRGHAVLTHGPDADGRPALAVWQLDAAGGPIGSCEIPLGVTLRRPEVLTGLRGFALVGWTHDIARAALRAASPLLPAGLAERLGAVTLALPDLLAEIRDHRRHRGPYAWPSEVPRDAQAAIGLGRPRRVPSPVATDAIAVAAALRGAIGLWLDTERVSAPGVPQPLPPRWLAGLRTAAEPR